MTELVKTNQNRDFLKTVNFEPQNKPMVEIDMYYFMFILNRIGVYHDIVSAVETKRTKLSSSRFRDLIRHKPYLSKKPFSSLNGFASKSSPLKQKLLV